MRIRKHHHRIVLVAIITAVGLAVSGTASPAAATEDPTKAMEDPATEAVFSYQEANGVSADLARAVLDEQSTMVLKIMPALGINDGVNADVWFAPSEGGQVVNVRTLDDGIIAGLLEWSFIASTVAIEKQPVMDTSVLDSEEMMAAIKTVIPQLPGMYVRISDGALILETTYRLDSAAIEELRTKTGFTQIEVTVLDEPGGDQIAINGGA